MAEQAPWCLWLRHGCLTVAAAMQLKLNLNTNNTILLALAPEARFKLSTLGVCGALQTTLCASRVGMERLGSRAVNKIIAMICSISLSSCVANPCEMRFRGRTRPPLGSCQCPQG